MSNLRYKITKIISTYAALNVLYINGKDKSPNVDRYVDEILETVLTDLDEHEEKFGERGNGGFGVDIIKWAHELNIKWTEK